MKQKHISILIIVFCVLAGVYFASNLLDGGSEGEQVVVLLEEVKADDVAEVKIEKGEDAVELAIKDGVWGVKGRNSYPADVGKIRSSLLKLFELKSSQLITRNPKNHLKLGVDETAVTNGKLKVSLNGKSGTKLAALVFGEIRSSSGASRPFASGQYVRLDNSDEVFLVGDQITVNSEIAHWLDSTLANVLSSKVRSVNQYKVNKRGKAKSQFSIEQGDPTSSDLDKRFVLKKPKLAKDKIHTPSISQVTSGLENLRLEDVFTADDESIKDLAYDGKTVFQLSNGLEYIVQSSEKDSRYYAKIEVAFKPELAEQIKKEVDEAAKKAEEEKEKAKEGEPKEEGDIPEAVKVPAPEIPELEISSAEEASDIQRQYQGWVYRLPEYIGKKFRLVRNDMIEKKEED